MSLSRPSRLLLRVHDAERARRETEARYDFLFERNSLPTWILDLESLEFLAVNEAAVRHYGYSRDEFLAMTIENIRVSEDTSAIELRSSQPDAVRNTEQLRHKKKDGSIIEVEIVWQELFYRDRHAVLVLAKDITERKRAREALRKSEARFRMMADTAPVMIWVAGTDKLCTFFNKPWLDFTGRTIEEEMGAGWQAGIHPDDHDQSSSVYAAAFDSRERFSPEYRLRRRDGEYRWVLVEGVPRFSRKGSFEGYIGSCIDITERKNMEAERDELLPGSKRRGRKLRRQAAPRTHFWPSSHTNFARRSTQCLVGRTSCARVKEMKPPDAHAIETIERSATNQQELIEDLLDSARIARGQLRLEIQPVDLRAVILGAIDVYAHRRGSQRD